MEAVALDLIFIGKIHIDGIIFHRIWLAPVEGTIRNGNNLDVSKSLAQALDFISSIWHVNRIAFFGNREHFHIFSINDAIFNEVIARCNNTYNNTDELVFVGNILLVTKNRRNVRNTLVQIFKTIGLDFLFVTLVIFESTDNFFALKLEVELSEQLLTVVEGIFARSTARIGNQN